MSLLPPPGQNRRLANINNILKEYKEPDISDKMIRKIKKKFPEIKDYIYLHTEEVIEKEFIQIIDLNLTTISNIYKCTKIIKGANNNIKTLNVRDTINKKNFKINPTNYYIFKVIDNFQIQINNFIDLMNNNKLN